MWKITRTYSQKLVIINKSKELNNARNLLVLANDLLEDRQKLLILYYIKQIDIYDTPRDTFWFLPHFDVICDLLLSRRMATWNLFVKQSKKAHHDLLHADDVRCGSSTSLSGLFPTESRTPYSRKRKALETRLVVSISVKELRLPRQFNEQRLLYNKKEA